MTSSRLFATPQLKPSLREVAAAPTLIASEEAEERSYTPNGKLSRGAIAEARQLDLSKNGDRHNAILCLVEIANLAVPSGRYYAW